MPTNSTVQVPLKLWQSIRFLIGGIAVLGGWMKQNGHGALYESAVAIAEQIDKLDEPVGPAVRVDDPYA